MPQSLPTERILIALRLTRIAGVRRLLFVLASITLMMVVAGAFGCSQEKQRGQASELSSAKKAYETCRFSESEATSREVLRDEPENVDALRTIALAQAAQGENEEAIGQYRRIVGIQPKDHASWYRMALLERIVGRLEDSAEHLERALSQKPGDPSYADELARAKMALGDFDAAAALWGGLLDDRRVSKESKKALYVLQGEALHSAKDYDNAIRAFEHALEMDPDDAALQARIESFD